MSNAATNELKKYLNELSGSIQYGHNPIAIVLAAGHGKRIRSDQSKMLHEIWGEPTVNRVVKACEKGLQSQNSIIVVGIKAREVATRMGAAKNRLFVLQEKQNGTGDAARVALDTLDSSQKIGDIFILPGDMGLLTEKVMADFQAAFHKSQTGMMILTGVYQGDPAQNYYGRIIRVPEKDADGNSSGKDAGKVIEIKEHKDILALEEGEDYHVKYNSRSYRFSKQELLNINEYNSGAYAVKFEHVNQYIRTIGTDNVQGEVYITDLISIFNENNISVGAFPTTDNQAVIGFNTKSVLYRMNQLYRHKIWKRLRDLVSIEDKDDFYIADEVAEQIEKSIEQHRVVNIKIGKGVHLGKKVTLNRNIILHRGVRINGNVTFGENTEIGAGTIIHAKDKQAIHLDDNCYISSNCHIVGEVTLGTNCWLDHGTSIRGDRSFPAIIGENVTIRGNSWIMGAVIAPNVTVEHCYLKHQKVACITDQTGKIKALRFYRPQPESSDIVSTI